MGEIRVFSTLPLEVDEDNLLEAFTVESSLITEGDKALEENGTLLMIGCVGVEVEDVELWIKMQFCLMKNLC